MYTFYIVPSVKACCVRWKTMERWIEMNSASLSSPTVKLMQTRT